MQNRTLILNHERSELSFIVTHMGFLTVKGTFNQIEASLLWMNETPKGIQGEIQVASIDTSEPSRDKTLLAEGYLDAEQFPLISFESTSIQQGNADYTIIGILGIKGVERTVIIPCKVISNANQSITITGETSITRSDFQLDFGSMDALIGDEIKLQFNLLFEE